MIMVEVSSTLKNRHFFTMKSFLTMLQRPSVGQKCVFCINKVSITSSRNLKKCEKFKILLESCRVTSKLSADSFMGRWDRMVPQKMDFKKKIFEKVLISCGPPLVTGLRDISHHCSILIILIFVLSNFNSQVSAGRGQILPQEFVIHTNSASRTS